MESSFIKLLVISTWVTSAMSANCYWIAYASCGGDQQMRADSSLTRYCCPISGGDTQDVILCEHENFQGDCITASLRQGQACINVDNNDWASSVNTLGKCIRLYVDANCRGLSKAYYLSSLSHYHLEEMNDQVSSVGRCFSHDQPSENCNRAKRQADPFNKCVFAKDKLTVGRIFGLTVHNIINPNSAMRWYQTGYNGRTESMEAIIERSHLGTGTDTNPTTRAYASELGEDGDDAGHILAKRLGGNGTDIHNIFPQNRNINRGVWAQAEASVALAVERRGSIRYNVNLEYREPNDTRPFKLVYQFSDPDTGEDIMTNDLVNPAKKS